MERLQTRQTEQGLWDLHEEVVGDDQGLQERALGHLLLLVLRHVEERQVGELVPPQVDADDACVEHGRVHAHEPKVLQDHLGEGVAELVEPRLRVQRHLARPHVLLAQKGEGRLPDEGPLLPLAQARPWRLVLVDFVQDLVSGARSDDGAQGCAAVGADSVHNERPVLDGDVGFGGVSHSVLHQ